MRGVSTLNATRHYFSLMGNLQNQEDQEKSTILLSLFLTTLTNLSEKSLPIG